MEWITHSLAPVVGPLWAAAARFRVSAFPIFGCASERPSAAAAAFSRTHTHVHSEILSVPGSLLSSQKPRPPKKHDLLVPEISLERVRFRKNFIMEWKMVWNTSKRFVKEPPLTRNQVDQVVNPTGSWIYGPLVLLKGSLFDKHPCGKCCRKISCHSSHDFLRGFQNVANQLNAVRTKSIIYRPY